MKKDIIVNIAGLIAGFLLVMVLSGCGKGDPGTSCSVAPNVNGATINCSDGTTSHITNGVSAQPCSTVSVSDGVQVTCPDGSSSTVFNGDRGPAGATGPTGSQGIAGLNGTSATAVQLCNQYSTTYPTSYPEFAFCIDENLYGVYWNGSQAFEALLVPGEYSSTSPDGCNFTVGSNCAVTAD